MQTICAWDLGEKGKQNVTSSVVRTGMGAFWFALIFLDGLEGIGEMLRFGGLSSLSPGGT